MTDLKLDSQMLEEAQALEHLSQEIQSSIEATCAEMQNKLEEQYAAAPKIAAGTHRMGQVSYYCYWNGDTQNPVVKIWHNADGNKLISSFRLWKAAKQERPQCGARCRDGHSCRARVVVRADGAFKRRCRLHGGSSTGPKTAEGRALIAESNRRRARL